MDVYQSGRICQEILSGRQYFVKQELPPTDLEEPICKYLDKNPPENRPKYLSINPADVERRRLIGTGGCKKAYQMNWLGYTFAVKMFKASSVDLKV